MKKEERTRWVHRWSISIELEVYKNNQMDILGFKNTVSSANELTEDDLLIIDSYDGRLESMDTEKSRFMVTGAACHKKYSGYQMYYLK